MKDNRKQNKALKRAGLGRKWWKRFKTKAEYDSARDKFLKKQ